MDRVERVEIVEGLTDLKNIQLHTALGMLLLRLQWASRDTGKAFYLTASPKNPQQPDEYEYQLEGRDV